MGLACASPAPPRAPGLAAADYFPLLPGTHWVYRVRSPLGSQTLEVLALGERSVRDSAVPLFLVEERMEGQRLGLEDAGWVGYFREAGYWHRYTTIAPDPDHGFRLLGSGAARVLPVEPRAGDRWDETVYVYRSPESGGGRQEWSAEVVHGGRVRTPAGSFSDVLRVRSLYWDRAIAPDHPVLTYEDDYARGVGLVRSRMRSHLDGGGELEQTLIRVGFPAPPG